MKHTKNYNAVAQEWLKVSRVLLESMTVAEVMSDLLPEVVGSTPVDFIRLLREEIRVLDEKLAEAEESGHNDSAEGLAETLAQAHANIRNSTRKRIYRELAGRSNEHVLVGDEHSDLCVVLTHE